MTRAPAKKPPRKFNVYIDGEVYSVGVMPEEGSEAEEVTVEKENDSRKDADGEAITAPLPGIILRYEVKSGDKVKTGDNIVVLEAMKMAIDLTAPVDGIVKSINYKSGDHVNKDDILAIISHDGKDAR